MGRGKRVFEINGCDEAQGYLFGRAMPPDQLTPWLARPHSGTVTRDHSDTIAPS